MNEKHIKKFKWFLKSCEQTDTDNILIAYLRVIGDTPQEIDLNIQYAVDHGKVITVVWLWERAYTIS